MASNQVTPSKPEAPLSFMQSLSPSVSLFDPDTPSTSSQDPKIIVVLSWFAAREVHIAKYIAQHRALFPSSRILLIQCPLDHILWPPGRHGQMLPAVHVLKKHIAENGDDGSMFLHVFSNGGVQTMTKLMSMMSTPFPKHVMVLDSCPGYFHWQRSHAAFMQTAPFWMSPFIHCFMAINWLLLAPFGREPPPDENAKALNGPALLSVQARRTYLYGTADEMVDWKDVEDHADKAAATGLEVRREVFEGGKHVAHVRVDAGRYWRMVKETWEGKQ